MTTSNATINASSQYRTEENKIKDRFSNAIRNRILLHNKTRFFSNPIRVFNNKSTFQLKPRNEFCSYKLNNKMQRLYGDKTNKNISYNLKKSKNYVSEDMEMKDDLIIKLNHTIMDLNKINKDIKDLQNLFDQEQKENLTHKFIINQILQENQNIKVLHDFNSPINSKNIKSSEEENNLEINNSKTNTIKVSSVKKVSFSKSFGISDKYSTIQNSIKRTKTRNLNKSKIDTLKKELDFYQRMIESREEKLRKIKKKEGSLFYNVIHKMIHNNNKKNEDLSKMGGEMRDKLIGSDERIFELSQKVCKLKDKNNKSLIRIESYKNKISEMEYEISYLKNEREKKQKEELDEENQKSKEESEINSLLNTKKELEEKYANKLDLKLEEYGNKLEKDNLFREEKNYKLKNEVYESKLEQCKKKNEELNKIIENYEKERDDLLEKSKIPRKNKVRIEELENEIKKLIEEVEGYEKKLKGKNNDKIKEEKTKK